MSLFSLGKFKLHSGKFSSWKIDCSELTLEDWNALASMVSETLPPFGAVEGVPTGGMALAEFIREYSSGPGFPLLICDDVLTTGGSMEEQRAGRDALGVCVFARGKPPAWVTPLFTYHGAG